MNYLQILFFLTIVTLISACKKERRNCKCCDNNADCVIYTMEEGTKTQNKTECRSFELPGEITCDLQ